MYFRSISHNPTCHDIFVLCPFASLFLSFSPSLPLFCRIRPFCPPRHRFSNPSVTAHLIIT